jgi:hypothetical protein
LTTMYGTVYYLVNVRTRRARVLLFGPGCDIDAFTTTIHFNDAWNFENNVATADSDSDSDDEM